MLETYPTTQKVGKGHKEPFENKEQSTYHSLRSQLHKEGKYHATPMLYDWGFKEMPSKIFKEMDGWMDGRDREREREFNSQTG